MAKFSSADLSALSGPAPGRALHDSIRTGPSTKRSTSRCQGGAITTASPNTDQTAVAAILVDNDGTILIGGNFTAVGGGTHEQLARINANGSVDPSFTTAVRGEEEVNVAFRIPPNILAIAAQPDGRIL